jgi:hypothetical protein
MDPRIRAAIGLVYDLFETQAESQMRIDAPWTDRTGNARAGLRALHTDEGDVHTLTLYHTMYYGFWLEVKDDGKYAIIAPTQLRLSREMPPVLAAAVRRAMESAA